MSSISFLSLNGLFSYWDVNFLSSSFIHVFQIITDSNLSICLFVNLFIKHITHIALAPNLLFIPFKIRSQDMLVSYMSKQFLNLPNFYVTMIVQGSRASVNIAKYAAQKMKLFIKDFFNKSKNISVGSCAFSHIYWISP